jgi:hypothetical protein
MLDNGNRGLLLTADLEVDIKNITAIINNSFLYEQMANAAQIWSRKFTLDVFEVDIKRLIRKK